MASPGPSSGRLKFSMKRFHRDLLLVLAFSAALFRVVATDRGPRFEDEIQAFIQADRAKPPVPGGILFVGSSIFREWTNVTEMMAPLPVVNRAFGGSRTDDQIARFDRVVLPLAPRIIVYYCGSNDIKEGRGPEVAFLGFKAFSERVRRIWPATRLLFVSTTRSLDRVEKWERVDHYNGLVRAYCSATPNRRFIDINRALVDADGCPRRDLYRADKLHFHPAAYVAFAALIRPVLADEWRKAGAVTAVPVDPATSGPVAP